MSRQTSFVIFAVMLLSQWSSAEAQCPSGDVFLTSQPEVEAFAASYTNCRTLPGNLTIVGTVVSTTPLAFLEEVEGHLVLVRNPDLQDASFPVLGKVGGNLEVEFNILLQSFHVPLLQTVGATFKLVANFELQDVQAPLLRSIGGDLEVRFAGQDVLELPALESIDRDFDLRTNENLSEIRLPNLAAIGENFRIFDNSSLVFFRLPSLVSIGNRLEITDGNVLEEIELPSLETVADGVEVNFSSIVSLKFPQLTLLGYLSLRSNPLLETFSAPYLRSMSSFSVFDQDGVPMTIDLPSLLSVENTFAIRYSSASMSLNFPLLESVGFDLRIEENDSLDVANFPALRTVENRTVIRSNENLRTVGIPVLGYTTGSSLAATDNQNLRNCCSFLHFVLSVPIGFTATSISNNGLGCSSVEEIARISHHM